MKIYFTIALLAAMAFAPKIAAQIISNNKSPCFHPFSYKYAELDLTSTAEIAKVLKAFESKVISESSEARGDIYVYGGKQTRIKEIDDLLADLRIILKLPERFTGNEKIWISNGGYRNLQSAELFIRPLKCSEFTRPNPDFAADQVEFAEAPHDSTIRKSPNEILDSLKSKTEIYCPPSATAVGACKGVVELFVIINEIGDVIFTSAISGHPLLRSAGQIGVKDWKFKPTLKDGLPVNVTGRISVEFKQRQLVVDY